MRLETLGAALLWIAIAAGTLAGGAASAQKARVFKWVDNEGTVHYTDRPPPQTRVEDTGIQYDRTDVNTLQARIEARTTDREARRESRALEDARAEEARASSAALEEERSENCARARERLESYETAHRLYRKTDDGGREYLSDEEIDSAKAAASESVSRWCD